MIKWVTKLMATLKKKAGKGTEKGERESVERSKYGSKKKKKKGCFLTSNK